MNDPDFHQAWLLHRRPYKERSVIARFLVEDHGIVAVVAQGVRQSRSRLAPSLQPFHRLLVRWRGRGELKTLTDLELDRHVFLTGERLYCGFYINELLLRAILPGQLVEGVAPLYQATLSELQQNTPLEPLLRSFELDLLELCGYAPPLTWEAVNGDDLQDGASYRFVPGQGLILANQQAGPCCYSTELLRALAERDFTNPEYYPGFKRLLRQAMATLIGERPLQSRMLFARKNQAALVREESISRK